MQKSNYLLIGLLAGMLFLFFPTKVISDTPFEKENKDLYREYVRLLNYGPSDQFYAHAARYEEFLKSHQMMEEYFKIVTNEGFFAMSKKDIIHGAKLVEQLEGEIKNSQDTTFAYLATGLRGDLFKSMRSLEADSIYKQALAQVGDRDPKFSMQMHLNLARVNYLANRQQSLQWADVALEEARQQNNYEFQSLARGLKCYISFMMAEQENFNEEVQRLNALKAEFDSLEAAGMTLGKQRFSHRYDKVIEVATLGFDGKFEQALEMTKDPLLNVDRQMVIFRLNAMEGTYRKTQAAKTLKWWLIILTVLYVFVYIMGRRRLMRKIWKRNEELKIAIEQADAANRMKAAFIRSMSHEIRTPLNAVNGFSQILCSKDYELTKEERTDIKERIASNSEAITIIINELLELAAGESVTLDLNELTPVYINKVCSNVMADAEKDNVKGLELKFSSELPDTFSIRSNEETIAQILNKIIDNALKFTNEGSVELHVKKEEKMIELSVTDTGIGIPDNKREAIFDNFVKLDDFKEGVGLGLSVCRRLAKILGGAIIIDPQYKTGSRFIVQLPVIDVK